MDTTPSISRLTFRSRREFTNLRHIVSSPECQYLDQITVTDVEDEAHRFRLWGSNIGVFQDEWIQSSLDYRLRDASHVRKQVINVLGRLEESLMRAITICSNLEPNRVQYEFPTSPSSDISQDTLFTNNPVSEIKEIHLAISGTITRLFRLSMLIRKPTRRDLYTKMASQTPCDPTFDINHVWAKFPAARATTGMVENLGKANARRRDYLKYREKHRGKLARVRSADAVPDEAIGGIEERLGPAKSSADGLSVFEQSATFSIAPASSMNDTKATTFIAPSLATVDLEDWNITDTRSEDGRSETSYATSTGETGSNALSVPPPPVALDAESPFECPYCYMIQCPSSWSEWKKHVFSDLQAYTCTHPTCTTSPFTTRQSWFDHELASHRKLWSCCICPEAYGEEQTYTSPEPLKTHATAYHSDIVLPAQLDDFTKLCLVPVDGIDPSDCPLCDEWGLRVRERQAKIDPESAAEGQQILVTISQFRKHLGNHLEQIALFALPRGVGGEDEEGDREEEEEGSVDVVPGAEDEASDGTVDLSSTDEEGDEDDIQSLEKLETAGELKTKATTPKSAPTSDSFSGKNPAPIASSQMLNRRSSEPLPPLLPLLHKTFKAFTVLITSLQTLQTRTSSFKSWKKTRHDLSILQSRLETQRSRLGEAISDMVKVAEWGEVRNGEGEAEWKVVSRIIALGYEDEERERRVGAFFGREWGGTEGGLRHEMIADYLAKILGCLENCASVIGISIQGVDENGSGGFVITDAKLPALRKRLAGGQFARDAGEIGGWISEVGNLL